MSTPMDTIEKLKLNTSKHVDQLEYSRAIGCLMYAMKSTNQILQYVGGAFSRASRSKHELTKFYYGILRLYIAAACKEAEWLRNLIHEIPIRLKPISPISIHCGSAATLAKAYSQMYNGKSRHLGVRHSMIRKLIMNG
ncbi:hypothetical protein Tco_0772048 [Tanacetum coccineum]|uniref:Zinc finger, CCHC-type n=1 Tax=Tanacetum coccineum TaxID=301880 RepID=A0ABQ4ZKF2_9ASTR